MKLIAVVFAFLFMLSSCNKDSDKSIYHDYQGKWVLVKMSGNTPDSETTGEEMVWQESYKFNGNGTFTKERDQNGALTESSGSLTVLKSEEGTLLELIHATENDIIGSCLGDKKEVLVLKSTSVMTITWNQCDGPGLEYDKMMNTD